MFLNILKNKIFFIVLVIGIMAICLSGCGKKKICTTQVCVEGNCQEIEIECEDESTDIQEPMPSNQDDDKCYSEVCVEGDCQQIEIDCEPEINDTHSTQEPAKEVPHPLHGSGYDCRRKGKLNRGLRCGEQQGHRHTRTCGHLRKAVEASQ